MTKLCDTIKNRQRVERLKAFRALYSFTQKQAARALYRSKRTIENVEQLRQPLSDKLLYDLNNYIKYNEVKK